MTILVTLFAMGMLSAQEPAATTPAADAAAKTVESTASPDLVGQLVKELTITPAQAEGAAGAMLGLAKTKLPAEDFAKVASAVPNTEGLIKAAPPADAKSSALGMAGAALGTGGMASLAGTFSKLALKPETIAKLAPTLVKLVSAKGGASTAALLAGALK
jgi:hypothetical protein